MSFVLQDHIILVLVVLHSMHSYVMHLGKLLLSNLTLPTINCGIAKCQQHSCAYQTEPFCSLMDSLLVQLNGFKNKKTISNGYLEIFTK